MWIGHIKPPKTWPKEYPLTVPQVIGPLVGPLGPVFKLWRAERLDAEARPRRVPILITLALTLLLRSIIFLKIPQIMKDLFQHLLF